MLATLYSIEVHADDYHYKVPHAKVLLAVTASPAEAFVLVFSTDKEESEELGLGTPAIIDLDKAKIVSFPKVESLQIDLNSAWRKDGKHVLVATAQGIFEASTGPVNEVLKSIVANKKLMHGIELSRSESKLAFWEWGESSLQLVVRNAATSKTIRTWSLPFAYGGETNGFEIAFQG